MDITVGLPFSSFLLVHLLPQFISAFGLWFALIATAILAARTAAISCYPLMVVSDCLVFRSMHSGTHAHILQSG